VRLSRPASVRGQREPDAFPLTRVSAMWRSLLLLGTALATCGDCLAQPPKQAAPAAGASVRLQFVQDLAAARKQATAAGKPLLVLNVLGDCHKHC
jgi:hypothetical protein